MARDVILADNRPASWSEPDGWGSFRPNGPLSRSGYVPNPAAWTTDKPVWAARLFVGFKVGKKQKYKMKDLVPIVQRVRKQQTGNPGSSFISQRGLYKHERTGEVIDEKGAQVIIINTPDMKTGKKKFIEQMIELAEEIASSLKQELVIVEIQRNGISQQTIGVTP